MAHSVDLINGRCPNVSIVGSLMCYTLITLLLLSADVMGCKHSEVEVATGLEYILKQAMDNAGKLSPLTDKLIIHFQTHITAQSQSNRYFLKLRFCTARSSSRLMLIQC